MESSIFCVHLSFPMWDQDGGGAAGGHPKPPLSHVTENKIFGEITLFVNT